MIKFHKTNTIPEAVPKGEENIWYVSPGGLFVADNEGIPRQIAIGSTIGSEIPVGVPATPNMIYFNKQNGKHYISTDKKWVEIPQAVIPGTGGGSSNAGNVMVNDAADNFVSTDVEGVLEEIAQKFPWYFGQKSLKDYNDDVNILLDSHEKYLTSKATNKPKDGLNGWIIQRKASDNVTYGSFVGNDGSFYTRVNNEYYQMAAMTDLTDLGENVNKLIEDLGAAKIEVGSGLKTNGNTISQGQKIELSDDVQKLIKDLGDGAFVKKAGDTMSGALKIATPASSWASLQVSSGNRMSTAFVDKGNGTFNILDVKNNRPVLEIQENGATRLKAHGSGDFYLGNQGSGRVTLESTSKANSIDLTAKKNENTVLVEGPYGSFHIGTYANGWNQIKSYGTRGPGANRNLRITGTTQLSEIWIDAWNTRFGGEISTQRAVQVGYNYANRQGTGEADVALRIFPRKAALSGESGALKNYAVLSYEQNSNILLLDSWKLNGNASSNVRNNFIRLSSDGFITRSSIRYKDPVRIFDDSVIERIKTTMPQVYTYKNDNHQEEQLGFIIERGVPKEAIEDEGKGINTYGMLAYLWRGVQETIEIVEKQSKIIDELNRQLAEK